MDFPTQASIFGDKTEKRKATEILTDRKFIKFSVLYMEYLLQCTSVLEGKINQDPWKFIEDISLCPSDSSKSIHEALR